QHPLPADPVAQRAEEETTEGAYHERRREDRERVQQRRGVVPGRKEVRRDVGGEESVDGEVEPLDGVSDGGAGDGLADHHRIGCRRCADDAGVLGHGSECYMSGNAVTHWRKRSSPIPGWPSVTVGP